MFEKERRKTLRFAMSLPVSMVDDTAGIQIRRVSRDVSSSGVSLFSPSELQVGALVTFTLDLPFEITLTQPVRIHCKGHVVRVESQSEWGGFVIALHRDTYDFIGTCDGTGVA
jgi:hypothetical protein